MRLIDADELTKDIEYSADMGGVLGKVVEYVKYYAKYMVASSPTIEERKKGKWTPKEERQKQEIFICSECGGWAYSPWIGSRKNPKPNRCKYNYCPNCGADMRGERE